MDNIEVYDQQGNLLEEYDPALGRLEESTRVEHHPAIEGVEEKWHYETIAEYPNGGKDVARVIDVEGVEAQDAWDETIPILVYVPYTQEELTARTEPSNEELLLEMAADHEYRICLMELGLKESEVQ